MPVVVVTIVKRNYTQLKKNHHTLLIVIYGSVTNKGTQDEKFKNILKIVLKAESVLLISICVGFMSFEMTFATFVLPKVNAPGSVPWCNHKE